MEHDPHRLASIPPEQIGQSPRPVEPGVLERFTIGRNERRRILLPLAGPSFESVTKFLEGDPREHAQRRVRQFVVAHAGVPEDLSGDRGGGDRGLIQRVMNRRGRGEGIRGGALEGLPGRRLAGGGDRQILVPAKPLLRVPFGLAAANDPEKPRDVRLDASGRGRRRAAPRWPSRSRHRRRSRSRRRARRIPRPEPPRRSPARRRRPSPDAASGRVCAAIARVFSSTGSMKDCPLKPGCTLMTSTRSNASATPSSASSGVSGLIAIPADMPSP